MAFAPSAGRHRGSGSSTSKPTTRWSRWLDLSRGKRKSRARNSVSPMRIATASIIVALAAINCSTASERVLVDRFFAASRLRDRTALARFATVVFEPRTDGIVEDFVVLDVTPER